MSLPKLTKSRRTQLEKVYGSAATQSMSQSVLRKLAQTEVEIAKSWRPARPAPIDGHNGPVIDPVVASASFKQVIVENGQRQREWLEKAVTHAALDLQVETEPLVSALDQAIKVWNSHADAIDKMFGERGFFGVRLARLNAASFRFEVLQRKPKGLFTPLRKISTKSTDGMARAGFLLDYLQATDPKPVYSWMADLLFMSLQSEEHLQHQSRARDGFWNCILRKRKSAMAVKRMALQHEWEMDLKETEEHQRRERFGSRHLMATGKWAQVASRTKYDDPATE